MTLMALVVEPDVPWQLTAVGILSLPVLILLNGFFVAAEFALVLAIRKTRIEEMVAHGVPGAKMVEKVARRLDRSIAATQLGITLASIALGWISEPAAASLLAPLFEGLDEGWGTITTHTVAGGLAFCLITFMHVVFGELIPKTLALQSPDKTALWTARPFDIFVKLTRPIVVLIYGTTNLCLHVFGHPPASGTQMVHSVEELALLIEDTEEAGILDPEQADLVQNVFRLSNKTVKDCMVPREKMATARADDAGGQGVLEAASHRRAHSHARL